jgi:transposase, IS30 family
MKNLYKRLSLEERIDIEKLLALHFSPSRIALKLDRNRSTITREINKYPKGKYKALKAFAFAMGNASKKRFEKSKINLNPVLKKFIYKHLKLRWSPHLITTILKRNYPNNNTMNLSHESIYLHIYIHAKKELKNILIEKLRQSRKLRGNKNRGANRKPTIKDPIRIDERPIEVNDRIIPGHWEGDLVMGKNRDSAIGTLNERTSRIVIIVPLKAKDSQSVRIAFEKAFKNIPKSMKKSMTYDNGTEMAQHKEFTKNTKINVFFAHPYSPWERPTNENSNGLIRNFFPKGTDFNLVTNFQLKDVQNKLNDRPRQVLDYLTPKQAFQNCIMSEIERKFNKNLKSTS